MTTFIEHLQTQGIRRVGTPRRGFFYRRPDGHAASLGDKVRIQGLRIPPAWKSVAISPSPRARLQALGKDRAGRWQYVYHPQYRERRDREKFRRLMAFATALPKMRKAIRDGMRRPTLDREKIMACILRVLSTCFIRPGSRVYSEENGSYGLSTMLTRHVKVRGDLVTFDYPGKSHQRQHRELKDRSVAHVVRALMKAPGRELFKFQDEKGEWVDVRRQHINQHIKEVMGEAFSAKDFRTWAGTLLCACALAEVGVTADDSLAARKKKIVEAVKATAAQLGNTPAVCRSAYIYPSVLTRFASGHAMCGVGSPKLRATERALIRFLRQT